MSFLSRLLRDQHKRQTIYDPASIELPPLTKGDLERACSSDPAVVDAYYREAREQAVAMVKRDVERRKRLGR